MNFEKVKNKNPKQIIAIQSLWAIFSVEILENKISNKLYIIKYKWIFKIIK